MAGRKNRVVGFKNWEEKKVRLIKVAEKGKLIARP